MSEKEFSCIKQVVKTVQIPLPATFISNETSGIAEILESWKRQYVKQLQGVVVNYNRYSLSSQCGFISPNKPFIYYNVRATFDLFCPKIGDIVKGRINRVSKEHVGCLIEDTINVTIYLSKNKSEEVLQFIKLNREILFEISYFNYDRKVIRVTGIITPECIQLMKDLFPPEKFNNVVDAPELYNTDEGIGTSSDGADEVSPFQTSDYSQISNDEVIFKKPFSSSKKSKKNKRDSEFSSVDTSEVSSSDEVPKKKKKRKDKKLVSDTLSYVTSIGNVSSVNHTVFFKKPLSSSKKSKKNKRDSEFSSVDTSEVSSFDEVPKKKKKRKDKKLVSDTLSYVTSIGNVSSVNHTDSYDLVKEKNSLYEDLIRAKKHKKKQKSESSPSIISDDTREPKIEVLDGNEPTSIINIVTVADDLVSSTAIKATKLSKRRKRDSQSCVDSYDPSTADEMPKKKTKHKNKADSLSEKEKSYSLDSCIDEWATVNLQTPEEDVSSSLETVENIDTSRKKKKKGKGKKSKEKDKSKKKKVKVLASGAVRKKDKRSTKNKLGGERAKKHKKSKSHKKGSNKKKKDGSKSKPSDVIHSGSD